MASATPGDEHPITDRRDGGSAATLRLIVVDDHPVARYGVQLMFSGYPHIEIIRSVASLDELPGRGQDPGQGAGQDPAGGLPDVFLLDLYLDRDRLTEEQIGDLAGQRPVLVMSASVRPNDVLAAIRAGASGFLPKSSPAEAFAEAVETAAAGGFYVSPRLADMIDAHARAAAPGTTLATLAPREREVLTYLAQGFTQRQTATRIGVSTGTIETYLKRIRQKLGPGNTVALIHRAAEQGQIDL